MIKLQAPSQIINHDEQLKLYRATGIVYTDGIADGGTETEVLFLANVQPLNGRELQLVPEGDRFKENLWVYCAPETKLEVNDRVVRADINYQVQDPEYWGSYCRARITRIDVGADATG